jgi:UDP-2,3-diacylglucosamine hydrolase
MKAVFISDAHLKNSADKRYVRLIDFLSDIQSGDVRLLISAEETGCKKTPIDDLYILGDFFDFWFCSKDRIYPEFQAVIRKLVDLQKTGVHIHWCEGNHDFFMKEYFQDVLDMEVFEEWATITLDNLRILISHGDTVDHSNWRYLMLRKILRNRLFYQIQRLIPASLRWALAGASSNVSKQMNTDNNALLAEKMHSFAKARLREDYDAVIMGHCHKPVLRYVEIGDKQKTSVTLGDWGNGFSFLYYENEKFFMRYYTPR